MKQVKLALSRRRALAPLDPDRFLAWAYQHGPHEKGTTHHTFDDLAFDLSRFEIEREDLRRGYLRVAARVRRNQRLGLDPWEGLDRAHP